MKKRTLSLMLLVLGGILLAIPCSAAEEKTDDALAQALKDAEVVFTATVDKVNPLGQTKSIPPSTFGNVTFKDAKALRGKIPEDATFSYSFKEGTTKHLDLKADGEVLVAVKGKGVSVLVPATEANRALAKKALAAATEK